MNQNGTPTTQAMQVLEAAVQSVPVGELPALLGQVERVKALAWSRMLTGPGGGQGADELLTVPEVAQRLKVSKDRAYELVRQGQIKKTPIGTKSVRVKPSDLVAFLAQQGG
jgi:excisionase family DNA binding protein